MTFAIPEQQPVTWGGTDGTRQSILRPWVGAKIRFLCGDCEASPHTRFHSRFFCCLCCWRPAWPAAKRSPLPRGERIGAARGGHPQPRRGGTGLWGIEAVDLDTGAVVYAHNSNQLFTPASNAKMFTTAAGLALVGGDYRFRTTVEASTAPDKYGRMAGDVVLVGRGDPNLSGRALPYALKTQRPWPPEQALIELADQVTARGVRVIDGDLVADDTFYTFERYAEGWTEDDLLWDYGAPVSALTINDNSLFLSVLPAEHVGERAL